MARFRDAMRRRRWRYGIVGDLAVTLLIAGAAMLLANLPAFRLLDAMFFDTATRLEPGWAPRVVVIDNDIKASISQDNSGALLPVAAAALGMERLCYRISPGVPQAIVATALPLVVGRPVSQAPASELWHFAPSSTPLAATVTAASVRQAPPQYGISRSQIYGLKGGHRTLPQFEAACAARTPATGSYLVRMPADQNIPRIAASQLVSGQFKGGELAGMIGIVGPPARQTDARLATPLDPSRRSVSAVLFSAYAVQALADGRDVLPASRWLAAIAIAIASLSAIAAQRLLPRIGPMLLVAGLPVLVAMAWIVLQFGNILLPLSAMLGGFVVAGFAQILRQHAAQDRRLAHTLDQAINLSFSRSVFYDQARTADYLVTLARLLKLPRMVVIERAEDGRWRGVAAHGAETGDPALGDAAAQQKLAEARRASGPVSASPLVPQWSDAAQLAFLSEGDSDLAWVYDLPQSRLGPHAARVAQSLTQSLRQMRQWQHQLLGGAAAAGTSASIDARVSSASKLITVQSEQIREGLDALDTAVLIFHPAGFAIQANARMAALCDQLGLLLERISIGEAICALTGISMAQSDSIVQRMLLRGGEMRVPMQDVASRQYVLRVGSSREREEGWQRVIVLEAVDISELDQLAELRLSVGMFIDRQLRNDLEAIALGATLALDPRLKPGALARVVGRIKDVTARATGRLEQVSELLNDAPMGTASPSYPIEARKSMIQAIERVEEFAADLSVTVDTRMPAISGFTLAEPLMLTDMVEAILRLVIADTAQGGTVNLELDEGEEHTQIKVVGGFGMPFDRLVEALDARPGEVPVEYQIAAAGFAETLAWQGGVSYWSAAGKGYRFNIKLRRIG